MTIKPQAWGTGRRSPSSIDVEGRETAILTASQWRRGDTLWADGSHLHEKKVEAAFLGQSPSGWIGRRYHTNNEIFDAGVFAICQPYHKKARCVRIYEK